MQKRNQSPSVEVFELLVGKSTDPDAPSYPLTITQGPSGEATGVCVLDPHDGDLQDALVALDEGDFDDEFLQDIGALLFDELFPPDIRSILRTSVSMMRAQEQGEGPQMRIRLRIEPPELSTLPWELLYDGDEDTFLAISPEQPLVRYVPARLPARPMKVTPPLRLLIVLANPDELESLDIEQEQTIILQALADLIEEGRIQVEFVEQGTTANISQAMRTFRPHIFHFIGHGLFDGEDAYVVLEDEGGQANPVDERTFREFFTGSNDTRLVLLNACQTASASSTKPLAGLAPLLLQRKLSAVIAMQYPISDHAAQVFSREFYRSLALGLPIDAAVAEARKGIYVDHHKAHSESTALDWAVPVLFMRAKDGYLFEINEPEPVAKSNDVAIPPPPKPATPPPINPFIGRGEELAFYANELQTKGLAVITGMSGVGKTALASELVRRYYNQNGPYQNGVFWYSFVASENMDNFIWQLAAFLAWYKRPDLWEMIQRTQLTGGTLPPVTVLFDYAIQLLTKDKPPTGKFVVCLDNFHAFQKETEANRNFNSDAIVDYVRQVSTYDKIHYIITTQRAPDFLASHEYHRLDGLDREATMTFLDSAGVALEETSVETLHQRTGGNPQFLRLAIDALKNAHQPDQVVARLTATDDIERYLMTEVDQGLDTKEREIMAGVSAFLGNPATREAVEVVTDRPRLRRDLTGLSQRHLLLTTDHIPQDQLLNNAQKRKRFERRYSQNPLIRDFYYDQLSRRERRTMHLRSAQYYRDDEVDLLQAIFHFQRAGEVIEAAELAVDHAQMIAYQGFAPALIDILNEITEEEIGDADVTNSEITDHDPELELWAKVSIAKGWLYRHLSQTDVAQEWYNEAMHQLADLPDSPPVYQLRAEVCARMGHMLVWHSLPDARRWLRRGFQVLKEQREGKPLDRILRKLEQKSSRESNTDKQGRDKQGRDKQNRNSRHRQVNLDSLMTKLDKQSQAPSSVFPETEAELHIYMGHVHILDGEAEKGLEMVQTGLGQLPKSLSHRGIRLQGLTVLGQAYVRLNQLNKARDTYLDALQLAEELGYVTHILVLFHDLMFIAFNSGEWPKALDYLHKAIPLAEQTGNVHSQTRLELDAGYIATDLGDEEDAYAHLYKSLELADTHDIPRYQVLARSYLARLYVRRERPTEAIPLLEEAYGLSNTKAFRDTLADIYRYFAQVSLLMNQLDDALHRGQKALKIAVELSQKPEEGKIQRVLGQIYSALGDYHAADDALRQSLTLLQDEPHEYARTQMVLAEYMRGIDESRLHGVFDVVTLLDEAAATFDRLRTV